MLSHSYLDQVIIFLSFGVNVIYCIDIGIVIDSASLVESSEAGLNTTALSYNNNELCNISTFALQCSASETEYQLKRYYENNTNTTGIIELTCSDTRNEVYFISTLLGKPMV